MPALLSPSGLAAPASRQPTAPPARALTVVVDTSPAAAVRDDERRLEGRRILLRGLTMVGLLVGFGWALAFGASQDPEVLQRLLGDAGVTRVAVSAALGGAAGFAVALAVVVTTLRR